MLRAVPSCSNDPVRVCRMCFTIDGRLYPMTAYKNLYKAYETLTGLLLEYEDNLPLYVCTECVRQLLNCAHFRTRSLRAHLILLDIIKKHDCITLESIQSVLGPSFHSLHLTHNQTGQNDLHMELVEEPGSCEDIPADSVKAKINDVINLDTLYTNQDILKHENDDNITHQDFVKDEDAMIDGIVDTSSLHGDTVLDVVKEELSNVEDLHGDTVLGDVKEELTNVEDLHGDPMEGGDYSSDDSRPLAEVALTAKLSATAVQQVTKPPEDLNHTKIDSRPKPGADGGLLIDDKPFCDICHYDAVNVVRLRSHLKAHAATKSYSCSVCKYITIEKKNLTKHNRVHSGEKPYACDVCNKTFCQRGTLHIHLRSHSGEKPYTCDVCNKSFSNSDHLQKHLRIHSGEKPYACDVCNKTFSQRYTLQIHLRSHSGEKPYTCDVCNKSFSLNGTLQKHLRTHSGEKPYTCGVCNKTFSQRSALQIHLRSHSGEKPYTCDVRDKTFC